MAKGKLPPRQKMINLMYLVFIAMMAMQVDQEVLRSFDDVNQSLKASTDLSFENNQIFYKQISDKAAQDPDYIPTQEKAQVLKNKVDGFVDYIEGLKTELKGDEELKDGENVNYNVLAATDPIVHLFFRGEKANADKGNDKAKEFVAKIETLKQDFISAGAEKETINKLFNLESPQKNKSWVENKFYNQPMIASLTNFSKLQSDARTEEGNTVRQLFQAKLIDKIEFTSTNVLVNVPSVIRAGEQENAFVAIGSYNDEATGTLTIGNREYQLSGGKAEIPLNTSPGDYRLAGTATYKYKDNPPVTTEFNEPYSVVSATLVKTPEGGAIMADKMNVVYRGVANPLTASLNGVEGNISVNASSGSLSSKGNGQYVYTPGGGNKVIITASGKTKEGKPVTTKREFRIKPVPPPQGQIRKKNALTVSKSSLSKLSVEAAIPDFEFPVSFTVTGFKVKVPGQKTVSVKGSRLGAAGSVLDRAKAEDIVGVFDIEVKASGYSGTIRNVSPVTIEVQ